MIANSVRSSGLLKVSRILFGNDTVRLLCLEANKPVQLSYNSYESTFDGSQKSPLVILHGLLGSKQNWNSICKALHSKCRRRIIAVDARNHGESGHSPDHTYEHMVGDIVALLKELAIERCSVLGHSMGGRTMMYLALKHPSVVDKAIIVDVSPITSSPNLLRMASLFDAMRMIRVPGEARPKDARQIANLQLQTAVTDASVRDFLLMNLVKSEEGSYVWRVNLDALHKNFTSHIAAFPEEALHMKYNGPVLFIGGGNSDFIKQSDLPKILTIFPNSNLKIIPNCGHWVHAEKPADFLKVTLEFLEQ